MTDIDFLSHVDMPNTSPMQCVNLQKVKDNVNDDVMSRHDVFYIDYFHHHDYRHQHEIIGV